ncbi:hypothetical protein VM98_38275, partial [Streptomyces rubellomurinus subsp. indigoferus]
ALSRSHALAPDGRSKTFSAAAAGSGRGEGVGVVAVMRLSDALAHGRTALALVRATPGTHDRPRRGITAPNDTSQAKLLRAVPDAAGRARADVGYVERDGAASPL